MKKHECKAVELIPHIVHAAMGVTAIVLSCEILKKLHRIGKGVREIREGKRQIEEGRREIFGHKKK